MTDKDRGTYSPPTEDNLSYETRRAPSRDQAPITLIISGICLVVLLLVVVLLYNSGLNKHGKLAPEVGDSLSDFKDGKVQDAQPLTDAQINQDDTGTASFAPGSDAPAIRGVSTDSASAPVSLAPAPVAPIQGPLPSQATNSAIAPVQAPEDVPVPGAPASASASTASKTPVAVKTPTPKPVAVTPPVQKVTAPVVTGAGGGAVQIGAFTSPEIANKEYAKVASSYGLFVGGAGKKIEKVETDKGTFYRTAFTGLSTEKAKSFCSALKAAGHDCIVR